MDHRKCPLCAEIIRKYVTICPYCNHGISRTIGQRAKTVLIVLLLIPVVLIIWGAIFENWQ